MDGIESALTGQVVKTILVNDDASTLVIETDNGAVILDAFGDCCSESWFADLLGVDTLLGQRIAKVEEIELPDYNVDDGRSRQESDQVYGYRFATMRGYADLIFRNSSNGYYGGWLGVGSIHPDHLTPITADWHST